MLDIFIIVFVIILIFILKKKELFENYKRCREITGLTKEVLDNHKINLTKKIMIGIYIFLVDIKMHKLNLKILMKSVNIFIL